MFQQIKNFFTEDTGANRRKAPRVDARGEAAVIIDGKTYAFQTDYVKTVLRVVEEVPHIGGGVSHVMLGDRRHDLGASH